MSRELRPNSTQIPDVILDFWLSELSGAELKVVLYVARRTYGFGKESDNISLSQISHGITKRDGVVLDTGTGLSRSSVARAIKTLEEQEIILRQINLSETSHEHEESTYSLNLDWQPKKGNGDKSKVVPKSNHPLSKEEARWFQNRTTGSPKIVLPGSPKIEPGVVPKSAPQETVLQETVMQETAATANASARRNSFPAASSAAAVSSGKDFHQESFDLLREQGFDDDAAKRLAVYPLPHIQKQIELLASRKPSRNPLGLLRRAIEGNYGAPNKPMRPTQTKQPTPAQDPAARAREGQRRDLEGYAAYREGQREQLKENHPEAYRAYERKSAQQRVEIARRSPGSMELTMFDKRGMEEPRFVNFFCKYKFCPVLSFEDWVKAGKPKARAPASLPTPPQDLPGLDANLF